MGQLAERIIQFIDKKNISDSDLLKKADISRQTLWRYKKGKHEPSLETVSRLLRNFPIRAYWLLTGEGDMEWKGKADPKVGYIFEKIISNEDVRDTLYSFMRWQENIRTKEISQTVDMPDKGDPP